MYLREREVFSGEGNEASRIELGEKLRQNMVSTGDVHLDHGKLWHPGFTIERVSLRGRVL